MHIIERMGRTSGCVSNAVLAVILVATALLPSAASSQTDNGTSANLLRRASAVSEPGVDDRFKPRTDQPPPPPARDMFTLWRQMQFRSNAATPMRIELQTNAKNHSIVNIPERYITVLPQPDSKSGKRELVVIAAYLPDLKSRSELEGEGGSVTRDAELSITIKPSAPGSVDRVLQQVLINKRFVGKNDLGYLVYQYQYIRRPGGAFEPDPTHEIWVPETRAGLNIDCSSLHMPPEFGKCVVRKQVGEKIFLIILVPRVRLASIDEIVGKVEALIQGFMHH